MANYSPSATKEKGRARRRKKKSLVWRIVFWVALVVFVASLAMLGYIAYSYFHGQQVYDEIETTAFEAPAEEDAAMLTLADFHVDWDALRAINPDVVAWVYIAGTEVSYPVVHKEGDSEYYLHHNFNNGSAGQFAAEYGAIMLDGHNKADFSNDVNLIYGHNMRNGTMFHLFNEFRDPAEFNSHRIVYLLTPGGNYRLGSFALDHVPATDADRIIIPTFNTDQELAAYVQARIDESVVTPSQIDSDPPLPDPNNVHKVFAFSTCDGANNTNRYILFCSVLDFLPLDGNGNPVGTGAEVVSQEEAGMVNTDAQERVE